MIDGAFESPNVKFIGRIRNTVGSEAILIDNRQMSTIRIHPYACRLAIMIPLSI